ncbi:MAG: alpha-mannosidase [Acidobacteriia bacterium]|nr:alpha-mannosidase [Terriglobia bacterium]
MDMNKTSEKKLYLVCNAHLDPVWLWNWEEGLAETLSTFRMAARFCEEFDSFVFCHNEALLYLWVEEHEPELFRRIQQLVAAKKWHIMGGWYLQPDCNLPCGESFVRQILAGKRYFLKKFGVEPTVGVNLDPFGHSRGLVQILVKSGYRGYLFCRPGESTFALDNPDFVWVGYNRSEILCHRPPDHYNSESGKAGAKVQKWLDANSDRCVGLLLWGIGNHGGGPSREDLLQIARLRSEETRRTIEHGTPEEYFDWLQSRVDSLNRVRTGLNPWGVGCYTSMARVKGKHRQLENAFFMTERMAMNAFLQIGADYPQPELRRALEELLFCEFHDSLSGTSVAEVEESVLQKLHHSLEILARVRADVFFKFLSGQPEAGDGEFPIFVYNSHPHDGEDTVICEFQPPEPNFDKSTFWRPELFDEHGNTIPVQLEKESCNIAIDQRKRIVFTSPLRASAMHRFSCRLRKVPVLNPVAERVPADVANLVFQNEDCLVEINGSTGLIDRYRVRGEEVLRHGAFLPMVMRDNADPWGMNVSSFRNRTGIFRLMTGQEAAEFSGVDSETLPPVRVIERGPVRSVVEVMLRYNFSRMLLRYRIPARGSEIELEVRVFWEEKDRMLKLSIPTHYHDGRCFGQVPYGVEEFAPDGDEQVAQKWLAIQSANQEYALTVINDRTYGFDFKDGELRLSLLRSAAYSGHPINDLTPIVRQDRFEARMDQGEHKFTFWMNCGPAHDRFERISKEAGFKNEPCLALCVFPSGGGEMPVAGIRLSNPAIQLGAWKLSEDGKHIILRLFETTGRPQPVIVTIPALAIEHPIELRAFELKSFAVDRSARTFHEVDLMERSST